MVLLRFVILFLSDGFNFDSLEALQKWKDKEGSEATYGKILMVFTQAGYQTIANSICEMIEKKCKPRSKLTPQQLIFILYR